MSEDEVEFKIRAYAEELRVGPVLRIDTTGMTEEEIQGWVDAFSGAQTDLEAYEAIEALVEEKPCPNCADAPELGCIGPHLVEGAEVTLFNKPGTVRWVLPEGKGVAVVFEDGQMFWAYGEHIGEIQER